jgi:hypothetical protein
MSWLDDGGNTHHDKHPKAAAEQAAIRAYLEVPHWPRQLIEVERLLPWGCTSNGE